MKRCTVCKEEKDLDSFYNYKASIDGKTYRCKECDHKASVKWKKDNPEKEERSRRGRQLKHKYGITIEEYEAMFEKQGNACACCGTESNSTTGHRKTWNFSVDHCHTTGKVRGLLCSQCNRAIGLLGDTLEGVGKAYKYLKETH